MTKEISRNHKKENSLVDLFDRSISYLRLSLTDRCNLRCMYCVTENESDQCHPKVTHDDMLSYEELIKVVTVAVEMGISKVRLTGGEPLLRRNVLQFIKQISSIEKLQDIRITTNGVLLEKFAEQLITIGVSKVNISLDTLKPAKFKSITGVDCFHKVWQGVQKALSVGFNPVKINVVAMRGINDDEIGDFARLSQQYPLHIRFIEFMPIGTSSQWDDTTFISADEIRKRLEQFGELDPVKRKHADGPAQVYTLSDESKGSIGLISPVSHHFCDNCNRLRLTSYGSLRSCLLHDDEIDLRGILRKNGTDQEIAQALIAAIRNKPKGHQLQQTLAEKGGNCHGQMSRIGG